jgi:hypothetical protein
VAHAKLVISIPERFLIAGIIDGRVVLPEGVQSAFEAVH